LTYLPIAAINTTTQHINNSDNDKNDILQRICKEYKIALEVMGRYPAVLAEFKERINSIW